MKKTTLKKSISKKTLPLPKAKALANKNTSFYIVGIGASAGGLEALKIFFNNTPPTCGMAFVVVQHLDPTRKSLLTELLAECTKMKVKEVADGILVLPDCIYIIPPNKELEIFKGHLQLFSPTKKRGSRRPIDSFFHSLAIDQKEKAIGIVLSGTGSDGSIGLKEIKAAGGKTFVQEPKSALFRGMPESAISGKVADHILPPEKMPAQLQRFSEIIRKKTEETPLKFTATFEHELKKIFLCIRNQTGYDFSDYKPNTIFRRLTKRMAMNKIKAIEDYVSFLNNNPSEIESLYKDFLIGVTSLFRDEEVFQSLTKKAIPILLKNCLEKQEIRIWVCGCSTGEEAYSLAMLLKEALILHKHYIKVYIFASDIDKDAIDIARSGTYSESAIASLSPERLSMHFIKNENEYQLKKEIREMVIFAHHNIIKDPPFSKMDMISCRNVLIYMNSDLQKKILSTFHYSLNNDGILLLGTSESIGDYTDLFSEIDQKSKIFLKKRDTIIKRGKSEYELTYIKHQQIIPPPKKCFQIRKK